MYILKNTTNTSITQSQLMEYMFDIVYMDRQYASIVSLLF